MQDLEWTIKVARNDNGELWWLFSSDGSRFCIGEYSEAEALCDKLCELVENGNHDGEIDGDDERIAVWLTVKQAEALSGISARSIRWACKWGHIYDARAKPSWHFTKSAFDAWVATRRKRRE